MIRRWILLLSALLSSGCCSPRPYFLRSFVFILCLWGLPSSSSTIRVGAFAGTFVPATCLPEHRKHIHTHARARTHASVAVKGRPNARFNAMGLVWIPPLLCSSIIHGLCICVHVSEQNVTLVWRVLVRQTGAERSRYWITRSCACGEHTHTHAHHSYKCVSSSKTDKEFSSCLRLCWDFQRESRISLSEHDHVEKKNNNYIFFRLSFTPRCSLLRVEDPGLSSSCMLWSFKNKQTNLSAELYNRREEIVHGQKTNENNVEGQN